MLEKQDLQAIAELIDGKLEQQHNKTLSEVSALLEQQTLKIEMKLENEVSKKIETLFDGYKLTHEKQWELERKVKELEERIEKLEVKAS